MDFSILSQFFGFLALVCWLLSVQTKNKNKILKMQTVANIFYALQYFLLGVFTAGCMNLVSTVRSICYCRSDVKDESNSILLLIIFIILILILGILTFTNLLSLIPIFLTLLYTYSTWQKNTNLIRWSFIIAAFMWIYYNVMVGAYISLIGNFFELISGFIAVIRFDLKKK